MEKERLNYQAPTVSQRRVVLQEVIAASYSPEKVAPKLTINAGTMQFTENENGDYAFDGNATHKTNNFYTSWEEE